MRKLSLVPKKTKLTMNVILNSKYKESVCEFTINQEFCSESEDSDQVLNELIYFIKRGSFIPINKKSFDYEMKTDMDICEIYFESFWNDDDTSVFYDKLMTQLNEILPYEIECSDEIIKNLNQEQIENLGDGGWSLFVKNDPEYALN